MEWFKHSTASHNDADFSDAWDEFGDAAPTVFWTILEIYGLEFSKLKDGWMTITLRYFERELRRKWKKSEKILEFFQSRDRIYFKKDDKTVSILIPKFLEIASNWTKRPKQLPTEAPTEAPTKTDGIRAGEKRRRREEDINTLVRSPASDPEKDIIIGAENNGCPHQKIISLYHEILTDLPQVRVWTPKRQKMLKARWLSSKDYQDLDWWKQFFEFVRNDCPHLTGKNDRQWTADLEWLCKEENFVKTVEGRYHKK